MKREFKIVAMDDAEIPAVVNLVNSAYRGESSALGWTSEADIIDGSLRVDLEAVSTMLKKPGAVILTAYLKDELKGCVYLCAYGNGLHLGMLSVSPAFQGGGLGKALLKAAEEHACVNGYGYIRMTVIDIRFELIAWYERHGYHSTGLTEPFPDNEKFGRPKRPMHFTELKKMISAPG